MQTGKKLKILIMSDYAFVKGGAEQVAIATAAGLAKENNEVVFFSGVGPVSGELKSCGLKDIICLNQKDILDSPNKLKAMVSGVYNFAALKELKKLLENWKPDIIHMHGMSKALSWAPILVAKSFKIPVIYTIHDYGLFCPNLGIYDYKKQEVCNYYKKGYSFKCLVTNCDKRSYGQKLWRWIRYKITKNIIKFGKKVDAFIVVSNFLKNFTNDNLKIKKPVKLIYNPLVINEKTVHQDLHEDKNVAEKEKNRLPRFLYVGRLSQEKGLDLLLEAIREVKAELIILGDGELFDLCKKASEETDGRVKVLGFKDKESVFSYMKTSDCLVLPSRVIEPAPLVLIEAGYNNLPCVVANHGGLSEFIEQGKNGFYFDPGSKSSLKEVMNAIIKSPGVLIQLKKNMINKIPSISEYTKEILKLYYEILKVN